MDKIFVNTKFRGYSKRWFNDSLPKLSKKERFFVIIGAILMLCIASSAYCK